MLKSIEKFYPIFNLISYIIGLFIFNFWISYIESGYFTKKKRFLDIFLLNYNKLKNIKLWIILIVFFAAVTLFSVLLSLFIIYEEKLGLKSAIHYINAFLNIYSVFGIYINVGFFIVQVTKDFSRQKNAICQKDIVCIQKQK